MEINEKKGPQEDLPPQQRPREIVIQILPDKINIVKIEISSMFEMHGIIRQLAQQFGLKVE